MAKVWLGWRRCGWDGEGVVGMTEGAGRAFRPGSGWLLYRHPSLSIVRHSGGSRNLGAAAVVIRVSGEYVLCAPPSSPPLWIPAFAGMTKGGWDDGGWLG